MISVIVPIYNTEKYLDKCLKSLIEQTIKDIEIICVNDGTTDNSQLIVDKYVKKYPQIIKSYIKENGGLSDARNYGIKKAKGKYIGFVDSDDWVEKNMFEDMLKYAESNNLDIVVCDTIMEYSDHSEILKSNLHYSNDDIRNYIIAYPMACTRIIKKELLTNEYLFTKGIFYEDLCLTPTFVNKTNKIGFLEKPLYHYLQRDSSIMNQKEFNPKLLDIEVVLNNVSNSFTKNKNIEKYFQEIEFLYITHLLRSTTIRFLSYKNSEEELTKLIQKMKEKFPDWNKNIYFKQTSFKLKLICWLAYHKKYGIIKLILKVRKK